ncbi:MAG: 1-acyl-sn-glycerol-3-phosphate acyltransferase [Leptolinea sp.]|jgi:1-acyl-sn-glycerol-3-phosphate acyltransferase|nr:1-acyl-sn-glycerol-3-phosphate acyltransferase [Leptolinea sp.]
MTVAGIVNFTIRGITRTICEVDDSELSRIPTHGPLILIGNHVNFLDAPILITHLAPRSVVPLVKRETWDNPALGLLFSTWKSIPIRRGEVDMTAFRESLRVLQDGHMLAIAPEGTRSGTGILQKGQTGMVPLAVKSGAPILPVAYFGAEKFWKNIRGLNRTPFTIRVGRKFHIKKLDGIPSREEREWITTEIMYQVAALLPPAYRGYYADMSRATEEYLEFK